MDRSLEDGELNPTLHKPGLGTKSWSSVVSKLVGQANSSGNMGLGNNALPRCNLSFHPPSLINGEVTIDPLAEILNKGNALWSSSLVGFFHSRMPFKVVEATALKIWGKYGLQKVFLHANSYFIFKFQSEFNRENVLALGPWFIGNKRINLKAWKEGINFIDEACSKTPIWVKFHNIPLSYLIDEGVSYLASGIGRPLFADALTEKMEPMNFARVCIEIEVNSVLHDHLRVNVKDEVDGGKKGVNVRVEYQSKPISCTFCNVFGHSLTKCSRANYKWVPKSSTTSSFPAENMESGPGSAAPANIPPPKVVMDPEIQPPHTATTPSSSEEWTTVDRGKGVPIHGLSARLPSCKSPTPISNSFMLISDSSIPLLSGSNITPMPKPLTKLKLIDENEVDRGKDASSSCSFDSPHQTQLYYYRVLLRRCRSPLLALMKLLCRIPSCPGLNLLMVRREGKSTQLLDQF